MNLDFTPEENAFRAEVRAFIAENYPAELRKAQDEDRPLTKDEYLSWHKVLAKKGWVAPSWPKAYGGTDWTPTQKYIWSEELARADALPVLPFGVNMLAPVVYTFGTEEQKQRFLPGILRGEINFAIGYTEPEAGTDLASLKTRAVRDGDIYVINGSKIFTSGADQADYVWLACRTDPDAPKHKGISIILVPTSTEGFSETLIHTVGDTKTAASYYNDVRVPVENRVGEENGGWRLITNQLNHERVGLAALGGESSELYDVVEQWAKGNGLIAEPWVQRNLAEAYARLEAMRLLNWEMARKVEDGTLGPADASSVKVFGTETHIQVHRLLIDIVGPAAWLAPGSPDAYLGGRLERAGRSAQINTFGGGVNEVQREIVATAGLGMTRQAR